MVKRSVRQSPFGAFYAFRNSRACKIIATRSWNEPIIRSMIRTRNVEGLCVSGRLHSAKHLFDTRSGCASISRERADRSASRPASRRVSEFSRRAVGREPKATRFPPATAAVAVARLAHREQKHRPAPRNAAPFNFAWYRAISAAAGMPSRLYRAE